MRISAEEIKDEKAGEYPALWVRSKDLQGIYEKLFDMYQGYKFCIMLDTTHEEYEDLGEVPVHFADCAFTEILEYIGAERVKEWIKHREESR